MQPRIALVTEPVPQVATSHSTTTRALALLVAGTLFMEMLDGTIVATAAPHMARSFGVRSADISVAITAYLVTVAVLIPLTGWLADRQGVRRIFLAAIAVFGAASALCALSTSLAELVAFRVLQGVGGAMMVPVGRLVVLRGTARSDVVTAIAFLTWPALIAPVVAPLAGGLITTYASWPWIFVVNVPISAIAFAVAWRLVPAIDIPPPGKLDKRGLIASVLGLGSLVYGASLLDGHRIAVGPVIAAFSCAAVSLAFAVLHLRRAAAPLVDLRPFANRTFRASQSGGSLFRIGILAVPFLLPLMFQDDFGWTAAKAGAVVVLVFVGNLTIKPATTPLLRRLGFRIVLIVSDAMAAITTAACALLRATTPLVLVGLLLIVGGMFRSIGFTAYNTIAFADIDDGQMTHANTLASTLQQVASGLGVAAAAIALRFGDAVKGALGHPASAHAAYSVAFVVLACLLVPSFIESWRLPASAGAAIGGATRRAVPP